MRKFGMAVAIAFGVLLSAAGLAKADIIQNAGTLDAAHDSTTLTSLKLTSKGAGTATYNFTLGEPASELTASFTSSSTKGVKALTKFTLQLFQGAGLLMSVNQSKAYYDPASGTTFVSLDFANFLAAGNYYLKLIVTAGRGLADVSGNITITPVPLPAALPMFGAMLVGLAGFGARRKS